MKTIGVLGGLGPQATMEFEVRVHRAAQRLIPQDGNQGYPPMVVYYFPNSNMNQSLKRTIVFGCVLMKWLSGNYG